MFDMAKEYCNKQEKALKDILNAYENRGGKNMAKVYAVVREDSVDIDYPSDGEIILGIFSTPEKATDAANEYIIKEWKEHSDEYTYRCPKTPLTYDDINCVYWTFYSDNDAYASIKIVGYNLDEMED